ncbi:MAG TPA: SpoIIE family protein phosphatase [Terrabacter sp.]|nr:SpoIIE family protein phosphatase [Terrabacter sp.]
MHRYIDELRLLQAIRLAVVATDAAGTITFVNRAATEVFGTVDAELVGHQVHDLIAPGASDGPMDLDAVIAGATWRGDLILRRPRGDTFVAAVSGTPVRDPTGQITGMVVVAEDMSAVRSAEAAAASSEARLRLAHEAAQLGSWHWNLATGEVVWDEQLEAIYGMAPGTFGRSYEAWLETVLPEDRDQVLEAVQAAWEARSTYVLRNRIRWPDGTLRWIEAHGKVTSDQHGNPSGTIGCVRDVTERMEAQQREAAAAARARLLQEVTAGFVRASTLDQVEAVLAHSLEQLAEILPATVELKVPDDLTSINEGTSFVTSADTPLSLEDNQVLDILASQCAVTAQRAQALARTVDIAEQLQFSLAASPLPTVEHIDLAVHYAAGGDEIEHVGGDWYDAVATSNGRLALVVGDVMGRGVSAATTMIRVRAGIRGLLTVNPGPAAVLTAADEMVARDAPEQLVTAAALLVDPVTGEMSLCNAGHIPPVVVGPDGCVEVLRGQGGTPLGVLRDAHRSVLTRHLQPGSLLIMVTDGVVESRRHDVDHGIRLLCDRSADLRDAPVKELVQGIAALADTSMHDDVTVMAARLR